MRKQWTLEQTLRGQNQRAKQLGAKHDLTMEQWLETLIYFDYKCAYCGGPYEVIEHYLPIRRAGTTVSSCVPACLHCNIMKDRKSHDLTFYQNQNVVQFIESKGVRIKFHGHEYRARAEDYVIVCCASCGNQLTVPGLSLDNAQEYIDEFWPNT